MLFQGQHTLNPVQELYNGSNHFSNNIQMFQNQYQHNQQNSNIQSTSQTESEPLFQLNSLTNQSELSNQNQLQQQQFIQQNLNHSTNSQQFQRQNPVSLQFQSTIQELTTTLQYFPNEPRYYNIINELNRQIQHLKSLESQILNIESQYNSLIQLSSLSTSSINSNTFDKKRTSVMMYQGDKLRLKEIQNKLNVSNEQDCINKLLDFYQNQQTPQSNPSPNIQTNPLIDPRKRYSKMTDFDKYNIINFNNNQDNSTKLINPIIDSFSNIFDLKETTQHYYIKIFFKGFLDNLNTITNNPNGGEKLMKHFLYKTDEGSKYLQDAQKLITNLEYKLIQGLKDVEVLKFFLEDLHYVSLKIIDKFRSLKGLKFLPSGSTLSHFKSYLFDYCRKEFQLKVDESGNASINVEYLVKNLKEYYKSKFDLEFTSAEIQADADKNNFFRITLKPLISSKDCINKFKEGDKRRKSSYWNQNSKFHFPIAVLTKDKETYKAFKDINWGNISLNLFLSLDYGLIFKCKKMCPVCLKTQDQFRNTPNIQEILDSEKYKNEYGIPNLIAFIPDTLHLGMRLVIFALESILKYDNSLESKLKDWIRTNIRSSFEYNVKTHTLSPDELHIWLNYNECKEILKMKNKLIDEVQIHKNVKTLLPLIDNILIILEHYSLETWTKKLENELKTNLNQLQEIVIKIRENHFYYSHSLCNEIIMIINLLKEYDLLITDLSLFGLENLHCLSNHYTLWSGKKTFLKINGSSFTLPYYEQEQEILRKLAIIIINLKPNLTLSELRKSSELQRYRTQRIDERKVPYVLDPTKKSQNQSIFENLIQNQNQTNLSNPINISNNESSQEREDINILSLLESNEDSNLPSLLPENIENLNSLNNIDEVDFDCIILSDNDKEMLNQILGLSNE